jgi:hypothetical protein
MVLESSKQRGPLLKQRTPTTAPQIETTVWSLLISIAIHTAAVALVSFSLVLLQSQTKRAPVEMNTISFLEDPSIHETAESNESLEQDLAENEQAIHEVNKDIELSEEVTQSLDVIEKRSAQQSEERIKKSDDTLKRSRKLQTTNNEVRGKGASSKADSDLKHIDLNSSTGDLKQRIKKGSLVLEGGSKKTEQSVQDALSWLARHQNKQGHWNAASWNRKCQKKSCHIFAHDRGFANCNVGVTALATLAFLGNGQSHRRGAYKKIVQRALSWLLAAQRYTVAHGFRATHDVYNHALATMALCELYVLSEDRSLLEPARKSVAIVLKARNKNAVWRYGMQAGNNDASVSGWMILALKAGRHADIPIPNKALANSRAWFKKVTNNRGMASYTPGSRPSHAMTAVALLSRIFCGENTNHADFQSGAQRLLEAPPSWNDGRGNFYYWYYGTYALFQIGGKHWKRWNHSMKKTLLSRQFTSGCEKGSWKATGLWCRSGGRVYATAMAALTLEIYYRFKRAPR